MRPAPLLIALTMVASTLMFTAASAQDSGPPTGHGHYFVDFRARPGALWGHTFIVYGRIGDGGRPQEARRAGLYPDDGRGGLIAGTFVPVRATVRAISDDYEEAPSAIYRRALSPAEYARLDATVRRLRATERNWHMVFYNCNDFADAVAQSLGLATPPNLLVPNAWVRALAAMNGG